MKTVDFSETIAACDLKVGRCRHQLRLLRYVSIEGQGHFFTIFQVWYVLCFTRPRFQVSVHRTIGPLVFAFAFALIFIFFLSLLYLLLQCFDILRGFSTKESKSGIVKRDEDIRATFFI